MSSAITLAAFAYLDLGAGPPPSCQMQNPPAPVAEYLENHVVKLAEKASLGTAPPAEFLSRSAKGLFDGLASKSGKDFEELATQAAQALHREMDNRTSPGLYVAVKRNTESGGPGAAILKLDVVEKHAGALSHVNGQVVLQIVDDLVDQPGALQKGAAVPDPRPSSQVIVGERLGGEASKYFLRGLRIDQMAHPGKGAKRLINTVQKVRPDIAGKIAAQLEATSATTLDGFLSETKDLLTPENRQEVVKALSKEGHPVRQIAPSEARISRVVKGDGITIEGRIEDMRKLKLDRLPGDRWRAEVVFDGKPEERYG